MPIVLDEMEVPGTAEEVSDQLRRFVERPKWFEWPDAAYCFSGSVTQRGFHIFRIVQGRDSFNPMLYGRFIPSPGGTRVRVLYTFHPIIWLFVLAWSGFTGFYPVYESLRYGRSTELGALFLFLILWVVALYFFYTGASRSKQLLRQCFGLQEIVRGGG